MTAKTRHFNVMEAFNNEHEIAEFLTDCYNNGESDVFQVALYDAIRHVGVAEIAEKTGLNRESLYKLKNQEPKLSTLRKLLAALGVTIKLEAA